MNDEMYKSALDRMENYDWYANHEVTFVAALEVLEFWIEYHACEFGLEPQDWRIKLDE